jgi:hypothetical protein
MNEKRNFKQTVVIFAMTGALIAASAFFTRAFAASPHFVGTPTCSVLTADPEEGDLSCSGKIAGLGNVPSVQAFLVATVTSTYGCGNPNNSGEVRIPPGQPSSSPNVTGPAQNLPVRNGSTTFSGDTALTIEEPAPGITCPSSSWDIVLVSITYSNVKVCVGGTSSACSGGTPLPISGTFSGGPFVNP